MSDGLEEKLSFVRRVPQSERGLLIEKLSKYSGYLISQTWGDKGVIVCGDERVPFQLESNRKFVGLSFSYLNGSAVHIELKNRLRQAIVRYFTGDGPRDFAVPFDRPLCDGDVQVLLSSIRSELKITVSLDGKTRLIMRNGKMTVGGSMSKKHDVLAFKCSYENALCKAIELHTPALTDSLIGFYREIEDFIYGYHLPQRL